MTAFRLNMEIKDYADEVWPPVFTIGARRHSMGAALADTVFSVRGYAETKDHIVVSARDQSGVTYVVPLLLPESALERALIVLNEKLPMTLREVGELHI